MKDQIEILLVEDNSRKPELPTQCQLVFTGIQVARDGEPLDFLFGRDEHCGSE